MGFECVSRTHVGLRRKVNEDAVLVRTQRGLWAVADGMGGHEAGEVASRMVTEALAHLHLMEHLDGFVDQAIAALQTVNHQLIELARADPRPKTIGSTIVGLAVDGRRFRCFWAGDSRAYRVRGNHIQQLSHDHSLVQGLVDAGMITADEAEHHPQANVITRAVGVIDQLQVDTMAGDVQPGDHFLLASDGLTRLVADEELLNEINARPPDEVADRLIRTVLARGAPDNVSLILVTAS